MNDRHLLPWRKRLACVAIACRMLWGASTALAGDALFQVSTLNALMLGLYDGAMPAEAFLSYGDTGLGTVHRLDGEMIALDGVLYQIKADGSIVAVDAEGSIPFGVITAFDEDACIEVDQPVAGMDALIDALNALTGVAENPNRLYVIKWTGHFDTIQTRSVPAQDKPYAPLSEVALSQQEFSFADASGTLVGVYFPAYFEGLNMPGWHLHYISDDRTQGGHLLDVTLTRGTLRIDAIDGFTLLLPDTEDFASAPLAEDLSSEIHAVER